jgi:putative ubiquitin-RnfH superfamily antitoxin RatB of RatAB toxin-antitoxin module
MAEEFIEVCLAVCCEPGQVLQSDWRVVRGTKAVQLIQMALEAQFQGTDMLRGHSPLEKTPTFGVWGRLVRGDHVLQAGDRLEIYRPLLVDPKVARRERFTKQGARATGLFAKKRPGAKAGY